MTANASSRAKGDAKGDKPEAAPSRLMEWAKIALLPLVIALTGYLFTTWQKQREETESNVRLYTQLVSQREQSDSQLRTEMFKAVIEKFISGAKSGDPHDLVLKLELLAYNFHESLDLGPLFKEVLRVLQRPNIVSPEERKQLKKRLDAAAATIIFQQVSALALSGNRWEAGVTPEIIKQAAGDSYLIDRQVVDMGSTGEGTAWWKRWSETATGATRTPETQGLRVRLQALAMNLNTHEVEVRLLIQRQADGQTMADRHFFVSPYEFPMLDNTRMPDGQRCSVVLTDFYVDEKGTEADKQINSFANLVVIVFPATSASLKDRIEYDELLHNMLRNRRLGTGEDATPTTSTGSP